MKTSAAAVVIYGALISTACAAGWILGPLLLSLASGASAGACLSVVFAALYIGELKQESISQLYQALAAADLRSAQQSAFSQQALGRLRTIRRLFLLSNIVKLLGTLAGVYLLNQKDVAQRDQADLLRFGLGMLFLSLILFARLWAEVASTETLLIAIKQDAALKARREAFLVSSRAAVAHDFDSDPAAKSFDKPLGDPMLMSAES